MPARQFLSCSMWSLLGRTDESPAPSEDAAQTRLKAKPTRFRERIATMPPAGNCNHRDTADITKSRPPDQRLQNNESCKLVSSYFVHRCRIVRNYVAKPPPSRTSAFRPTPLTPVSSHDDRRLSPGQPEGSARHPDGSYETLPSAGFRRIFKVSQQRLVRTRLSGVSLVSYETSP